MRRKDGRLTRAALWLIYLPPLALLLLQALASVQHLWGVVRFPYQLDYGEAPELNRAVRLARGEPIYVDWSHPPYQMANYTPLYPAVVSLGVRVTGPDFLPGRALSFASTLGVAGLLALTARALGAGGPGALFAALLWLGAHPVWIWGAYQRVDALAMLLELAGVTVFALGWMERKARWAVWASVPLFVAAAYTRQTSIAGAFACYGYLLFRRPRLAAAAIAAYGALGLGLLELGQLATGGLMWKHIVEGNLNAWSLETFRRYAKPLWELQSWAFVLAGVGLALGAHRWRSQLPLLYLLAAAATTLTVGKIGAYVNYLFPLCAALALCAGLALGELARLHLRPALLWYVPQIAVSLGIVVGVRAMDRRAWPDLYRVEPAAGALESARQAQEYVARLSGDVFSEDMAFTVTTGKRIYLQPFEFSQLAHQGAWDQRPLLDDVRTGRFVAAVLRFDLAGDPSWHAERLTDELLAALREAYVPAAVYGDYYIYRPASHRSS